MWSKAQAQSGYRKHNDMCMGGGCLVTGSVMACGAFLATGRVMAWGGGLATGSAMVGFRVPYLGSIPCITISSCLHSIMSFVNIAWKYGMEAAKTIR